MPLPVVPAVDGLVRSQPASPPASSRPPSGFAALLEAASAPSVRPRPGAATAVAATGGPGPGPGRAPAAMTPASMATVSLGEMVSAYAGAPLGAGAATIADPAGLGVQTVSTADGVLGVAASGAGGAGGHPVLAAGEQYLGVPYQWGGTSPQSGFDCSGFVQRAFADIGVSLPRVSVDQSRAGQPVAGLEQARPGDLVYWNGDGNRPNHIGIYAGDNQMLVAPSTGDVVRYQEITRTPDAIRRVG